MMKTTNKELVMMELNDDELNQVTGGLTSNEAYLGTCAALLGLFFFQIPGAIFGAIWGADETPIYLKREQRKQ